MYMNFVSFVTWWNYQDAFLPVYPEPTEVILKNGKKQNGNLKYTIRPIQDAVEYFHQQQMKKFQEDLARENAKRMLEEYDKKHPRESA